MILPHDAAPDLAPGLDLGLIRKYSVPAPRYTSYPPATQFVEKLDGLRLEEAILDDNRPGAGPLSLYFHLPFCQSACWYCGCNKIVTRSATAAGDYLEMLEREVAMTAARMDLGRPVTQIHLGGGTPTFLSADELLRLGRLVSETFDVDPDCEFSVEIDPRHITAEQVEALRAIGANRASLGIQDTDPAVQLAIHRWQPPERNALAVRRLRRAGFESVGIDLIFGLPLQTVQSFSRTVEQVLELKPDRLSVFSYAHVPWFKPMQRIFETRRQLPTPESKLEMFAATHSRLTEAGYVHIGMDHFARPDDELAAAQRAGSLQRNFQGYSTRAGASLYGFGISSISSTAMSYRQNAKGLPEWKKAIESGRLPIERGYRLSEDDRRRRSLIMHIMCDRRIDFSALSSELGLDVAEAYAAELASLADLEADGLVRRSASGVEVTPAGALLIRVIAARFDAGYRPEQGRHSQSV